MHHEKVPFPTLSELRSPALPCVVPTRRKRGGRTAEEVYREEARLRADPEYRAKAEAVEAELAEQARLRKANAPARHPRLTDAQGQMLQDGITLGFAVGGGGLGAVVGHIVGGYGPSLFGRRVDDRTATQVVIAGCILGTVLGAGRGHRVACLTLLAFGVHWGEEDEEPPERPWRGWS